MKLNNGRRRSRAGECGSNEAEFGRSTALGVVEMLG
jgi:hypothetical protein